MYEGNYIGVTKDVLNFAAGIAIGMAIGFFGITGGWAIGLSVVGGIVAGGAVDFVVDNTIGYINRRRG